MIVRGYLVEGAEARRFFLEKEEAQECAGKWGGAVIPLISIEDHEEYKIHIKKTISYNLLMLKNAFDQVKI